MKRIKHFLHYIKAIMQLRYAIRVADMKYVDDYDRFYVLPDERNRLIIMNRTMFRNYKRNCRININASISDLKRESFYFTPTRNGREALSPIDIIAKREMWIAYYFRNLKSQ